MSNTKGVAEAVAVSVIEAHFTADAIGAVVQWAQTQNLPGSSDLATKISGLIQGHYIDGGHPTEGLRYRRGRELLRAITPE